MSEIPMWPNDPYADFGTDDYRDAIAKLETRLAAAEARLRAYEEPLPVRFDPSAKARHEADQGNLGLLLAQVDAYERRRVYEWKCRAEASEARVERLRAALALAVPILAMLDARGYSAEVKRAQEATRDALATTATAPAGAGAGKENERDGATIAADMHGPDPRPDCKRENCPICRRGRFALGEAAAVEAEMVRHAKANAASVDEEQEEHVAQLIAEASAGRKRTPLGAPGPHPPRWRCPACRGLGERMTACSTCDGTGVVLPDDADKRATTDGGGGDGE